MPEFIVETAYGGNRQYLVKARGPADAKNKVDRLLADGGADPDREDECDETVTFAWPAEQGFQ